MHTRAIHFSLDDALIKVTVDTNGRLLIRLLGTLGVEMHRAVGYHLKSPRQSESSI